MLIGPSADDGQLEYYITSIAGILECIYTSVLTVIFLWFICKYKQFVSKGRIQLSQHRLLGGHLQITSFASSINEQRDQGNHSSSFQIILFGIGSVAYYVFYLVNAASEHPVDVIKVVNKGISLVCFLFFIIFLCLYKGASLKACRLFQYSIALMIGADVWAWIFITVKPLWTLFNENHTSLTPNNSSHSENQLILNFETVIEIIESFLQPFFVEFLTISAGCLLSLWFTMRTDTTSHIENNHRNATSSVTIEHNGYIHDYGALLIQVDTEISRRNRQMEEIKRHRCHKYIVIVLSAFVGIGYFTSMQFLTVGPFSECSRSLTDKFRTVMTRIIQGAVFAPLVIMNVVSLRKLQTSNVDIAKVQQFTSSDNLLLLLSTVNFVYLFLRTIGAAGVFLIERTSEFTLIFYTIFTLVTIGAVWVQTQLIVTANYVYRSVQKLPKFVEFTLIYIVAINMSNWLFISVAHKWAESDPSLKAYVPEFVTSFGSFITKGILLVFDPIEAMFSFHSVVAAYHSLRVKYD